MNKLLLIGSVTGASALLLMAFKGALSDDDWGEERLEQMRRHSIGVAAPHDPVYQAECGSCHMAYPPGLLPAVSWQKIMDGLADHFGDNAELEATTRETVTRYLLMHSADQGDYRRSRAMMRDMPVSAIPTRITELPYFRHEHDEVPSRLVSDNPQVGSFANCIACHRNAERGSFSEHEIDIPGVGRWDD